MVTLVLARGGRRGVGRGTGIVELPTAGRRPRAGVIMFRLPEKTVNALERQPGQQVRFGQDFVLALVELHVKGGRPGREGKVGNEKLPPFAM